MVSLISVTGRVVIPNDALPRGLDPSARLHEALVGETLDGLVRQETVFRFRNRSGIHTVVPRPGGERWRFEGIGSGSFELCADGATLTIRYRLTMLGGFIFAAVSSVAIGILILVDVGHGHGLDVAVIEVIYLLLWSAACLIKAWSVRRWLRRIMIADRLPAPARLEIPVPVL